ncbi:hypothetical protein SEVIR_1G368150v4 [Setaria viridis]
MWLDRETGAKCYMLSARALCIIWGNTPEYWGWIPLTDSSFSEAARLLQVWWLEIRGKIDSKMLSQNSTYAAYIVFKVTRGACPWFSIPGDVCPPWRKQINMPRLPGCR